MKRRHHWWTRLFLAAGIVLASGCGGAADRARQDPGPPDPSATLRVGWTQGLTSIDPHMAQSEILTFRYGLASVYDRLFTVDARGEVKGMLVKDWAYGKGGRTLTLKLREDVTFRDGTPLDAAAVKTSLDRARTLDSPVVKKRMAVVSRVDVVKDYEVALTLERPSATVPNILSEVSGFILHPDLIKNGDPSKKAEGSGAYRIVKWLPGERIVLERDRDDYWDEKAARVERIEHRTVSDFQAFSNALAGGQIDLGSLLPHNVLGLEGRGGLKTVRVEHGTGMQILFNRNSGALKDLDVRRAVNYAYDRKAITDAIFPGSVPAYQHTRSSLNGYDPGLEGSYERDLGKARKLLAEAGHPEGVDLGKMLVPASNPPGLGDVIQEQLGEAGIKVTPVLVDYAEAVTQFAGGKVPLLLHYVQTGTDFGAGVSARWYPPQMNPAGTTPEFDRMYAAASDSRLSAEERDERYRKLNRFLVEQAWSAPVAWINYPWVMSEKVLNFNEDMDYSTTFGPYDLRYVAKAAE
ncbi:ABC transporter substrate-binding protein [Streptomyces sp. NPDC088746]|uniref:ABC transporter substrate-binding protein n=1 Tax=Streptomyces sp. NPDC088746 TaxID=3365885 RepID=UPI00382D2274